MHTKDWFWGVFVTAIWGVNFSVIKLGLGTLDPFILAALRFCFVSFPALLFMPKPNIPIIVIASYGILFGLGLWGLANLGVYLGVDAGSASLLLQFSALISVFFGLLFFRERLSLFQWGGIVISFLGLLYILTIEKFIEDYLGVFFIFCAATSWALSNVIVKKYRPKNMLAFIVWSCAFAPLPLFLMAYLTKGSAPFLTMVNVNYMAIFSVFFQAYISTIFGYRIWNNLLIRYPLSTVAPLSLLVPIFGFFGYFLIFGDSFTVVEVVVFLWILCGFSIFMFNSQLSVLTSKFSRYNRKGVNDGR